MTKPCCQCLVLTNNSPLSSWISQLNLTGPQLLTSCPASTNPASSLAIIEVSYFHWKCRNVWLESVLTSIAVQGRHIQPAGALVTSWNIIIVRSSLHLQPDLPSGLSARRKLPLGRRVPPWPPSLPSPGSTCSSSPSARSYSPTPEHSQESEDDILHSMILTWTQLVQRPVQANEGIGLGIQPGYWRT